MSGSIDASIPLHAGQGVTPIANPLTQYGDFVHLQGALNQNALFPGQQQLQQQQITHGDQTTQSNATNLALQTRNAVYSHLAPYMADADPTLDKVTQALGTAHANGLNVNPALDELHATFPVSGTAAERRQWIANRVGSTLSPAEQVAAATPQHGGFIGNGPDQVPYSKAPALGPNAGSVSTVGAGAPISVYPSRTEQMTQVEGPPTENNEPQKETLADRLIRQGRGDLLGPGWAPTGAPATSGAPSAAPSRSPPSIAGMPQFAQQPVIGHPAVVGLPAGANEAAVKTAGSSADMGQALTSRADMVNSNKAQYSTLLDDLNKLNTMGPGTEREVALNGLMQKLTGYGVTMNKDQVAGAESFNKIASQIALAQAGTLGATDQRVQSTMGANPHLDMSKLGNERVIHMLQGNEDAIAAKNAAWQQWITPKAQGGMGNGTGTYGQFSTQFNKDFDPRVFQSRYMSGPEISEMRRSMSPEQQRDFLRRAKAAGVIE